MIGTLIVALKQAAEFVEMAAAADNSGQEYDRLCQECGCRGRHGPGCRLEAWLMNIHG